MDHIIVEIYANKASKKGVPNNHDKKKTKQNALLFCGVFPLLVTLILIFSSFSSYSWPLVYLEGQKRPAPRKTKTVFLAYLR